MAGGGFEGGGGSAWRGEGEEAGGHGVFLSQMRSDLVFLSLARPDGPVQASSSISRSPRSRLDVGIAKHCLVMSVITPTWPGRPRGPYASGHLGMKS